MFRAPFIEAALFLAFFMLTDPPTSPNQYGDQIWYGLLAAGSACVAQLLGAGQVYLLIGLLVANTALAGVRMWRRRSATPRAAPTGWQALSTE
jgi:Na+-translocating ferredoxin:NAD+ oxidoreductase RnfD subunit